MYFHRLIVALGACAMIAGAYAATTVGSLEPTSGTWRAYRGSGFTTQVCTANSEAAVLACAAADAERRSATTRYQIRYPNRYLTVTYSTPTANRAPTISGTPAGTGQVGAVYRFAPTAADPDGDELTFAVWNQPRWATFNTATGELIGTPTADDVAYHADITISVSDGQASATLKEFSIAVKAATTPVEPPPPAGTGTATLSWEPPTLNLDGTPVSNVAGYRICYGKSPDALAETIQISNPAAARYDISAMAPGTYYFAIRAYTSGGNESPLSNVVSKVVM